MIRDFTLRSQEAPGKFGVGKRNTLKEKTDITKEIRRATSSMGLLSVASVQNKNTQTPSLDACKLELLAWRIVGIGRRIFMMKDVSRFSSALAVFFFASAVPTKNKRYHCHADLCNRALYGPHSKQCLLNTLLPVVELRFLLMERVFPSATY